MNTAPLINQEIPKAVSATVSPANTKWCQLFIQFQKGNHRNSAAAKTSKLTRMSTPQQR
ncbi:MAG: hypothetical protein IM541_02810 [Chitinophagaceae bacterium]|nr:hypothetical protein [Chitinophagaceae bacterium]